ncbi:hypothetical protein [Myxococcus sp. RHSTA-1-4]|uniref:hypothetical protein n=1 Tax=Myxococcus sp. RHSTA-1-4 TaxID=2874601 RepID=UPI001CC12337|nr:hypothetical protein [Myxococcus sp. RHSTA-1-4]MBZ4419837.1 hypothetical protein [Myxococcus sp. RHSTA-1-4]
MFPAGYFFAADLAEARELANQLAAVARQNALAVVLGVDTCDTEASKEGEAKRGSEHTEVLVAQGHLPFFILGWSPGMPNPIEWRQRSTTGNNWKLAPALTRGARRILEVHGRSVDVVACGEGFNRALRFSIEQDPKRTAAIVIAAHTSQGSRIWNATKYFASDLGLPTLLSVHQALTQYGEMLHPGNRVGYAEAEVFRSFGDSPQLHAGAFAVPTPAHS